MSQQGKSNQLNAQKARQYFVNQVKTATKEQLLLMMFDGAIRFCKQAKERMVSKDIEEAHNLLIRVQRIMMELISALDTSVGEELYDNLVGLYGFVYTRLVEANLRQDQDGVDEALVILESLRETWREAVTRAKMETNPEFAAYEEARRAASSG